MGCSASKHPWSPGDGMQAHLDLQELHLRRDNPFLNAVALDQCQRRPHTCSRSCPSRRLHSDGKPGHDSLVWTSRSCARQQLLWERLLARDASGSREEKIHTSEAWLREPTPSKLVTSDSLVYPPAVPTKGLERPFAKCCSWTPWNSRAMRTFWWSSDSWGLPHQKAVHL